MASKFYFLFVFFLFSLASGCVMDAECGVFNDDICENVKCLTHDPGCYEDDPDCEKYEHPICAIVAVGECSRSYGCGPGFFCNSDCKCEKEPVSKERKEYCHKLIGNFLEPHGSFEGRDVSYKMDIIILLREYELNCGLSEGEFMTVDDFILNQNIENRHQII